MDVDGAHLSAGAVLSIRAEPPLDEPDPWSTGGENDTPFSITASFSDGPLRGSNLQVEPVEGRPPKTVDIPCSDGATYRYCLEEWVQQGASAKYGFLYPV